MKGRRMIIATTSEYGTDEDTEITSRVTRSIIDNFLKRPSLDDQAIRTIAVMANNDLAMMRSDSEGHLLCDAAFVFLDRNKARFLVSGRAAAYHFENGKLVRRTSAEEADIIGSGMRYEPHVEPVFELKQEQNAFLVTSPALAQAASDEQLAEALKASKTPEEWMEKLRALAGDKEFCAITAFLPVSRPGPLEKLLGKKE